MDRAALDVAIDHDIPYGGWAPRDRQAEYGEIPVRYQLTKLTDGGYRQRNKRNVADSDGTLIVNLVCWMEARSRPMGLPSACANPA